MEDNNKTEQTPKVEETKVEDKVNENNTSFKNSKIIKELSKRDVIIRRFVARSMIVNSIILGLSIFCFYLSYNNVTDDELQVYACPANFFQDSPIMLTKIEHERVDNIEKYIRGFIRQYIRAIFPKNSAEAKELYTFAGNHSTGRLRQKYLGMASKAREIGSELDQGRYTDFFTKRPITDKNTILISRESENKWKVEIEGFLNDKKSNTEDDRGVVTIKMTVEKGEAKLHGSYSGLYVSSFQIVSVKDHVSGTEEEL